MIGYVTKGRHGHIWFHKTYPQFNEIHGTWFSNEMVVLPCGEYPELQSITEPTKVKLTLKLVNDD